MQCCCIRSIQMRNQYNTHRLVIIALIPIRASSGMCMHWRQPMRFEETQRKRKKHTHKHKNQPSAQVHTKSYMPCIPRDKTALNSFFWFVMIFLSYSCYSFFCGCLLSLLLLLPLPPPSPLLWWLLYYCTFHTFAFNVIFIYSIQTLFGANHITAHTPTHTFTNIRWNTIHIIIFLLYVLYGMEAIGAFILYIYRYVCVLSTFRAAIFFLLSNVLKSRSKTNENKKAYTHMHTPNTPNIQKHKRSIYRRNRTGEFRFHFGKYKRSRC